MDLVKESIIKAGAATLLILLFGVLVGLQVDDARGGYIQEQLRESNLQAQSFIVTQNYLEESSKNYCNVVKSRIPELSEQNREIGQNLQSFSGKSISNDGRYDYLKRKYYLNQLKLYNILTEYKQRCGANTTLIFYFFDSSADSQRQGAALTKYYREVDNSSYIFSYNLETDDSDITDILISDFNVTNGPAVVINGNQTYRRYVPFGELRQIIQEETVESSSSGNATE
jgi:hypothetical protein